MGAQNRTEIMQAISRIDSQIEQLAGQIPMARSAKVVAFPWGLWAIAVLLVGSAVYGEGTLLLWAHSYLYEKRPFILALGSIFVFLAVIQTIRSIFFTGHWHSGSNRRVSAQIEALRQERTILSQQLRQLGSK